MAICRPEAIDDAPAPRAEAQRRMAAARTFLASARNGRRPGEESRAAAVAAQAIEAPAVLRPDQAIERPCGRAPNSLHWEKTWPALVAAHKRYPAFQVQEEGSRSAQIGQDCGPPEPQALATPQFIDPAERVRLRADLSKPYEDRLTTALGCRPGHSADFPAPSPTRADDHACLAAPASRWVAGPPSMRRPSSSGGTNSAIRAQAVPPTATRPDHLRRPRARLRTECPIWAKPSVPL